MEEGKIRSRKPIHSRHSGSYRPSHGSPIRRSTRHLSPNLSGSEDDEELVQELMEHENCPNVTASSISTVNSSPDAADGGSIKYSYTERNVQFHDNGKIRELNQIKIRTNFPVAKKEESSNFGLWLIALIVLIGLIVIGLFAPFSPIHRMFGAESRPKQLIRCSFERLKRDFPNQNKILWESLEHGVESVLNIIPTSPSIFLLAYEDVNTVNRITRNIVERTTEFMNSKVDALELSPADLAYSEMKADYGVVIKKYENQLKRSGVMLVNDLNKVPSQVVPAFHVFCDVQNPLVDRSIIFLTLHLTRQINPGSNGNALQLVENYLRSNWSDIENFILEPLITRVTDQVFVLNKD